MRELYAQNGERIDGWYIETPRGDLSLLQNGTNDFAEAAWPEWVRRRLTMTAERFDMIQSRGDYCKATVATHGQFVEMKFNGIAPRTNATRGLVSDFSPKARARMMQKIKSTCGAVHDDLGWLFVTLTYARIWPADWKAWKRNLKTFLQALKRAYPGVAGYWKLEPQVRGAPHFHLLVHVPSVYRLGDWFASIQAYAVKQWHETCYRRGTRNTKLRTPDPFPEHEAWHAGKLGNEHCVQQVRSLAGVHSYASKYLGKDCGFYDDDGNPMPAGRFTGTFGRPTIIKTTHILPSKPAEQIKRSMRRYLERVKGCRQPADAAKLAYGPRRTQRSFVPCHIFHRLVRHYNPIGCAPASNERGQLMREYQKVQSLHRAGHFVAPDRLQRVVVGVLANLN